MITTAQRNAILAAIETAYTVDGHAYTAFKTWRNQWSGELADPVIRLQLKSQGQQIEYAVGRRAEWDQDVLVVDVFAGTDTTNMVHGDDIVEVIARDLSLWFRQSGTAALATSRLSIGTVAAVQDLPFLEEGVFRKFFEVNIIYKLF